MAVSPDAQSGGERGRSGGPRGQFAGAVRGQATSGQPGQATSGQAGQAMSGQPGQATSGQAWRRRVTGPKPLAAPGATVSDLGPRRRPDRSPGDPRQAAGNVADGLACSGAGSLYR